MFTFNDDLRSKRAAAVEAGIVHETNLNSAKASAAVIAGSLSILDEAIKAFNKAMILRVQEQCLAEDDPMLVALKNGFHDKLNKAIKQDKESGMWSVDVVLVDKAEVIDIRSLHKAGKKVDKNISHNDDWLKFVPSLHRIMTVAVAKACGDTDADRKAVDLLKIENGTDRADWVGKMPSLLDESDLKSNADPFSVGSLKKIFDTMAYMILGDDAPFILGKYIRAMLLLSAKEGKEYGYRMQSERGMFKLFTKVMSAAVNGMDFTEAK